MRFNLSILPEIGCTPAREIHVGLDRPCCCGGADAVLLREPLRLGDVDTDMMVDEVEHTNQRLDGWAKSDTLYQDKRDLVCLIELFEQVTHH